MLLIKNVVKKILSKINFHLHDKESISYLAIFFNYILNPNYRKTYNNYLVNKNTVIDFVESRTPLPRSLYFEGTNVCNADCVFCPYSTMKRTKTTMTMDFFKDIVNQYIDLGGQSIGFTPIVGDPFADKFLLNRIDYLNSKQKIKTVSFYTNAIALKPKHIDQLVKFKNLDLIISISYGGHDKETFNKIMGVDKFDLVQKNLIYLFKTLKSCPDNKLNIKLDFRFPDKKKNSEFYELVNEVISKKLVRIDSLEGNYDTFGGRITQSDLDKTGLKLNMTYPSPKIGPCEIPFTKPLVLANGFLNACAERDLETDLIVADLRKEKLSDALYGQKMKEFVYSFYNKSEIPTVCKECSVYSSIYNPNGKITKSNLNWMN